MGVDASSRSIALRKAGSSSFRSELVILASARYAARSKWGVSAASCAVVSRPRRQLVRSAFYGTGVIQMPAFGPGTTDQA
jgi:hypothetical protein